MRRSTDLIDFAWGALKMHCGSVRSVSSVACLKKWRNVQLFRQQRIRRPSISRFWKYTQIHCPMKSPLLQGFPSVARALFCPPIPLEKYFLHCSVLLTPQKQPTNSSFLSSKLPAHYQICQEFMPGPYVHSLSSVEAKGNSWCTYLFLHVSRQAFVLSQGCRCIFGTNPFNALVIQCSDRLSEDKANLAAWPSIRSPVGSPKGHNRRIKLYKRESAFLPLWKRTLKWHKWGEGH